MIITIQHQHKPWQQDFTLTTPGVTFGRSRDNAIALPDPARSISLYQGAITVSEDQHIVLRNLASTPIVVNDQQLHCLQSITLSPQETSEDSVSFVCGDYAFTLSDREATAAEAPAEKSVAVAAAATTVMATVPATALVDNDTATAINRKTVVEPEPAVAPVAEAVSLAESAPLAEPVVTPESQPVEDVFGDLFEGSGVVPIGGEVDLEAHPFDLPSSVSRNSNNPLKEIDISHLSPHMDQDPLISLSRDGMEHQQRDIFYDRSPTTLSSQSSTNDEIEDELELLLQELAANKVASGR